MDSGVETPRQLAIGEITAETDTRDILDHARQQAKERNFDDVFIVDTDSHHTETESWKDIANFIDDDVIRFQCIDHFANRTGSPPYGLNGDLALRYQDVGGRIIHQGKRGEKVEETDVHRDVVLAQRAYKSMSVDYTVVFPTPMLNLGVHPQFHMESVLGRAYNAWFIDRILSKDPKLGSMIYLPFNDPDAALKTVQEYADTDGVVGFMVTSVRHKPVHHNAYIPIYNELNERKLPLAFHAGLTWGDDWMKQLDLFISMHSISFVLCNMVHLTNWIVHGMQERFPNMPVLWIESGVAWLAFMMQRLDSEYMMRPSEAPLLKKLPSEYMKDMFYTPQPIETSNMGITEAVFKGINADTQFLYASDWPHWDFNPPSTIYDLPFLDEQGKRNILGENAARLFNLDIKKKTKAA